MTQDRPRATQDDDLGARLERSVGRAMFASRWIMAPVYVGLLGVLLLDVVKFMQKLVLAVPAILQMGANETVLLLLTLVDLSLVGNLVVIVVFAGWETLVSPLAVAGRDHPLAGIGFSSVKQKLIGSIAAIAAIQLLETFVHIGDVPKQDAMWQLAILLGIGLTGVLLALMDKLSGGAH